MNHNIFFLKRIRLIVTIFIIINIIICTQIILINIKYKKQLNKYTDKQSSSSYIFINRGDIYDRNNNILAFDMYVYDIYINKQHINNTSLLTNKLSPIINKNSDEILNIINKHNKGDILIDKNLSVDKYKQILELKDNNKKETFTEIYGIKKTKRYYPYNKYTSNILGYVDSNNKGKYGLESIYNNHLSSSYHKIQKNIFHDLFTKDYNNWYLKNLKYGNNIKTTIDINLQEYASDALDKEINASHAKGGSVVIQNAITGEILTMSNNPNYDPNNIQQNDISNLNNQSVTNIYEPGSTLKPIAFSYLLENHIITPTTTVNVPDQIQCADKTIHDDVNHDIWHLTATGVLAKSSNVGTILLSNKIESNRNQMIYNELQKFHINQNTHLLFPNESHGILQNPSKWSGSQQCTILFGQGIAVTAMQMTSMYSTIVNNGKYKKPIILYGNNQHSSDEQIITPETSQNLINMLHSTVTDTNGTGYNANIPNYLIGGKTGTANEIDDTGVYNKYTASFIGYIIDNNQKYIISTIIHDPIGEHFGSEICIPVFNDIVKYMITKYNIQQDSTKTYSLNTN